MATTAEPMTPDKPDTPQAGGAEDTAARAICSAKCGYRGERACWWLPGAWPNPECDEPGCHAEARAVLSALPAPAAEREAALREAVFAAIDDATINSTGSRSIDTDEFLETLHVRGFRIAAALENTDG